MAAPTVSLALQALRRRIARRFDDNETGSASGGSASGGANSGGTLTATGKILRFPSAPSSLLDAEMNHINTTNTVQSNFIQSHSVSGTTATFEVYGSWTAPTSSHTYEIHKLSNSGFTKQEYDDAVNSAIDSVVDGYWTDSDAALYGIQNGASGVAAGQPRREYPIPPSLNYLYNVSYLDVPTGASNPSQNADTTRSFANATASRGVWQSFKVANTGYYEWLSVTLAQVGTVTGDTLRAYLYSTSSSLPNAQLTNGLSDAYTISNIPDRNTTICLRFSPPVHLTAGTTYAWFIERTSGSVDASNYFTITEDTGNSYGEGTAGLYNGSTFSAISASDFTFSLFPASTNWQVLAPKTGWQYRRIGSDVLYIPGSFYDGTPIRVAGGTAIAEVSAETDTVPIRPEYVEAKAIVYLLGSKTAASYGSNYGAAARLWAEPILAQPRPTRALPPNAVIVRG